MRHEYPIHLYSEHPNVWLQPDNNVLRNYWNRLYYRTPIPHHHDRHERWDRPDQGLFAVSTPSTPPFFPKAQTRTESPVLIREFSPRLFREISRAMIRMYQCTDIRHLQPRENSNINVIIEGIPHFTATKMGG